MAKDVINVDGKDTVVREDTAKAYRGTIWILITLGIVLTGAAILFFVFFGGSLGGSDMQSPKEIEQKRQTGETK
jgi:flagellar basal body-associated protein FliL